MSNTHEANIVRIGPILAHPNADKLELTMVGGYQVVIGKGSFKEGDLAVYIQPDSVVPQTPPFKFIWEQYSVATVEDGLGTTYTDVPEKRRRITVKRLRKEYSEGLLMPTSDFLALFENDETFPTVLKFNVGDDVSSIIGITHYVPEFDVEGTKAETAAIPKRKYPRSLKGWFFFVLHKLGMASNKNFAMEVSFEFPVYDVNALKNAKRHLTFIDSESVLVTEKIHGSNARFVFIPDDEKDPMSDGKFYVGSHTQWKMDGANVWWNAARQFPEIEEWCVQNPGLVLYGEVGPTQKGFRYGAEDGETFFFAFDVYDPKSKNWGWPGNNGFAHNVPSLYAGPYSAQIIKDLVDGQSKVPGAKNIREGVVISSRERRLKLKVVSNAYLEADNK